MNKSILWASITMLIVGVATGYLLFGNDNAAKAVGERLVQGSAQSLSQEEKKPLFYRNPMNPDVTSPSPAKDAMGMDYVPVYADNEASKVVGTVKINPVVVQNIGVRTAIAQRTSLSRTIRAVGRVDFDEESMLRLHPKVEGWVEEMRVDKTGQAVAKDDVLLSIYSPKLVSTQQEYLLALNNLSTLSKSPFEQIRKGAEQLVKSSLERLRLLDVPTHQIKTLERTRTIQKTLHIHAPVNGTVINIGARQGQFVTPNTELYMMVDLNKVWVYAEVYEYELPWVKLGDEVEMTLASVPGKTFKGSLSYIYPYAESKTRTTKLRLIFDNSESLLRPDMFAQLSIHSDPLDDVIVIPAEAVIRTGDRTQVFIVRGPGKFEPRIVTLGIESNGKVAVLAGVDAGDEVVTSAQFLIDSESKLREATAKMMAVLKEAGSAATDGATGEGGDKAMEDTDPSNSEMADQSKPETQGAHVHD
ncbi:efflux RND transporter periplasmic adaptor subunit [Dasania marina]|uniref:efflux RND transporter periplasmic adaptor subunit n=1 Tax=Dasania marina TaxID=471499 RepID=UPI00037ABB5A|nr:efflux RND transporter periplasmic adaptor subunit [Dasania marina]